MSMFRETFNSHALVDIGFKGPQFTWRRGGICERLDRVVANLGWQNLFPSTILSFLNSDHMPLLLQLSSSSGNSDMVKYKRYKRWW